MPRRAHTILANPEMVRETNLTARHHEQIMSRNGKDLLARISNVNDMVCEKPSIDLTHEAMAWSGKFPIDELEIGSRELEILIKFDAFDEVHQLPLATRSLRHGLG